MEVFGIVYVSPVIAPPTLYQHQQVKRLLVFLIIRLEVIVGILYETFDFGFQQQVGHDVASSKRGIKLSLISYRDREGLVLQRISLGVCRNQVQAYLLQRLIRAVRYTSHYYLSLRLLLTIDKEQAVGIHVA